MFITQTPKYLLSLLLCIPLLAHAVSKSVSSDTAQAVKVQTVNKTATRAGHPTRGMTMKQVRKHYGKPQSTRKSVGKIKKKWPLITVWNYGRFSVYFERHITLHTVVH